MISFAGKVCREEMQPVRVVEWMITLSVADPGKMFKKLVLLHTQQSFC